MCPVRSDAMAGQTTSEWQATSLVLVRHGESNVTVNRTIGGRRTCSGLSELGRQQAERLRDRLSTTREFADAVLLSSDFPRAIETAELIAPALGTPGFEVDPGFGEHDPGPEIDGMSFEEYVDRFGIPDWAGDPHQDVFPGGGETVAQFHDRVARTIEATLDRHRGSTVMVACHGGVVDAAFRQLLGLMPRGVFELHTVNTSISEFVSTADGTWRLVRYNDAAHLAGLPAETPRTTPVS